MGNKLKYGKGKYVNKITVMKEPSLIAAFQHGDSDHYRRLNTSHPCLLADSEFNGHCASLFDDRMCWLWCSLNIDENKPSSAMTMMHFLFQESFSTMSYQFERS